MAGTEPKFDWIEAGTKVAARVGLNPIRVRWKLTAWQKKCRDFRLRFQSGVEHVKYEHQVCQHCGAVQDRAETVCLKCGLRLDPRWLQILNRVGGRTAHLFSMSSVLILAIILCYLRTVRAQGDFELMSISSRVLINYGGNLPNVLETGEWWRLLTYIFLHAGLWHILFNVVAIQQIGPQIEQVFGRGRMLFYFLLTGVAAGIATQLWGLHGVGIGASGSIMGLIGLGAGWAQRVGTGYSRQIRDQLIRWAVYTFVFGFVVGADNAAHAGGFVVGGVLGFFSRESSRRSPSLIDWFYTVIGVVLTIGAVGIILWPKTVLPTRIVDFGVYQSISETKVEDENVAGGLIETPGIVLREQTDQIPARIGTVFGFRYVIESPQDFVLATIKVKFPGPLKDPVSGKSYEDSEWSQTVLSGRVNWNAGWLFENEWEVLPGEWRIEVWVEEVPVLEKVFFVK